jgi:hypothetical protein
MPAVPHRTLCCVIMHDGRGVVFRLRSALLDAGWLKHHAVPILHGVQPETLTVTLLWRMALSEQSLP